MGLTIADYPNIAAQWHPTKNGDVKPEDVSHCSSKAFWWQCPKGEDHEWTARAYNRTANKSGCPICDGKKVVLSNCLATTHPTIAADWHPTKNGTLTFYDVNAGSNLKSWWLCRVAEDHEWVASVHSRTGPQNGCPMCRGLKVVLSNCLATTHPAIAAEWHPTKNGSLTPYDVTRGSHKKVWWQCSNKADHCWQASPNNRTNPASNSACPKCKRSKSEELIAQHLDALGIPYIQEFSFTNCKHKRSMPFDFFVFPDGRDPGVIEFQGWHHYHIQPARGGERRLEQIQRRDRLKKEFCESRQVSYLEIPYWNHREIPELIDAFIGTLPPRRQL